jgi:hypothetical protein
MTKNVILIFFVVSVNISALMGQTDTYQINWPDKYEPQKAKFFVHNEIFIEASAKEIWDYINSSGNMAKLVRRSFQR